MRKPLGVIFDLGETVLHSEKPNPLDGTKKLLEIAINPDNVTAEEIQDYANSLAKEMQVMKDEVMLESTCQSFQRLLFESFNVSFKEKPEDIEMIFARATYKNVPSKGIFHLLDTLDNHNIKKGALSNSTFSEKVIRAELEEYDLQNRFDFIISTADYGIRKPHKIIFDLALKKMNLPPEDVWFIGDSLKYDIKGAINAGLHPIWYNSKGVNDSNELKYYEVRDFDVLAEDIDKLYASENVGA